MVGRAEGSGAARDAPAWTGGRSNAQTRTRLRLPSVGSIASGLWFSDQQLVKLDQQLAYLPSLRANDDGKLPFRRANAICQFAQRANGNDQLPLWKLDRTTILVR